MTEKYDNEDKIKYFEDLFKKITNLDQEHPRDVARAFEAIAIEAQNGSLLCNCFLIGVSEIVQNYLEQLKNSETPIANTVSQRM